ncbi:MAG: hypothetical protein ACK4VN_08305 [Bacteroidales bacterium]
MRKPLLLWVVFLLFLSPRVFSGFWVVCNIPGSDAHYTSIQSAIEQAMPHDTIYVKGSPLNYGNVLLEKPLTLIAEGYLEGDRGLHTAKLTRVLFTSNPYRRTISSGSSIKGFEFPFFPGQRPNIVTVANSRVKIEDITIERNWMWFVEVVGSAHNWVFKNNIIRGWVNGGASDSRAGASDFFFYNNILNTLKGFGNGRLHVENNVIMGRIRDVSNAWVGSNIFTRNDYIIDNVSGSQFFYNVVMGNMVGAKECYEHSDRFETRNQCSGKANTGSQNRIAADAGFRYWPTNDIMGGSVFRLSEGSVARRAGPNGQQAGIFGGPYPFPERAFLNPEIDDPFPAFVTSIY